MPHSRISGMTNADIANLVRQNAGIDYQNRIPVATQGNLRETLNTLQSYTPAWNTFIEVLLDQCALPLYRKRSWENALAKFKTGRIRNGSWVQEVGYYLIQAHSYDKTATNVFGLREPDITVNFHLQNRKDKYVISLDEDSLAQAFLDEGGLEGFLNGCLMQVQNSDNIDEYLIMRELFAQYNDSNGFYNLQVPDLAASSNVEGDAKKITQMIRETYLDFAFPNRAANYNPERVPYVSNEVVLFANPKFMSTNDVYNLASAFNVEYAKFMADIVQIVDEIPIPGAQAVLADRDWFVCTDTKIRTSQALNNDGDFFNHFLHHWGVYSASRMAPAVLFSTAADSSWEINTPTYTGVTLALADGYTYASKAASTPLAATVQGTNEPNQACTFTIQGGDGYPVSTNTHITSDNKLWVGSDEKNSMLTITAASMGDPTKTASLAVGIGKAYSAPTVNSVAISSTGESVARGGTMQFTADVTAGEGVDESVYWVVLGASTQTAISADGLLTVGAGEPATSITVLGISQADPTKTGSTAIAVTAGD